MLIAHYLGHALESRSEKRGTSPCAPAFYFIDVNSTSPFGPAFEEKLEHRDRGAPTRGESRGKQSISICLGARPFE